MPADRQAAADRVRELLVRVADAAGVDADIEIHDTPDGLVGEYVGEDVAPLIGHHGQTIDAIQHLAYRIAAPGRGDRVSVVVDADGYREERASALRQSADQAAETALSQDRAVSLEPMSALERKIIHEHLKERRELETYSEGQEPARRLVVAPIVAD